MSGEATDDPGFHWDSWAIVLVLFALGSLGNAFWMLASPPHWYQNLPAGVPDFGPMNEHFIRDIGCAFAVFGVALLIAARRPGLRTLMLGLVSGFYGLHAVVHVYDTLRGLVGFDHWATDFSGVYLPAVVLVLLTWRSHKSE